MSNIKSGDKIDTVLNEGEGFQKGRLNGQWVTFEYSALELKPIKETKVEEWLEVSVKNLKGFTKGSPIEMCLEETHLPIPAKKIYIANGMAPQDGFEPPTQ